jgi:hypothetical protein
MATLTVTTTYPDNLQTDLRDTLAVVFSYQETIDGSPNPQTKSAFVQQKLNENFRDYVKRIYKQEKERAALQTVTDLNIS